MTGLPHMLKKLRRYVEAIRYNIARHDRRTELLDEHGASVLLSRRAITMWSLATTAKLVSSTVCERLQQLR